MRRLPRATMLPWTGRNDLHADAASTSLRVTQPHPKPTMGDESRTDRIVASPARKAIGYGVRAVHVVAAAKGAKISRKDALLKKFRSARPWYVLRARKLWLGVAGNDP